MNKSIPLIQQRVIEANIFGVVYKSLCTRMSREDALAAVRAAVDALAYEAGKAFAKRAPNGASFEHFASILEVWQDSGALTIDNVAATGNELTFEVTRCAYVEKYREMGLPQELVSMISCARDEPFAEGYSSRLSMERTQTLGDGAPSCSFRFIWRD
jgi:hypothetical protein